MDNYNPNIDTFLQFFSQSLLSTGLTRGLDESTYVPTHLDTLLKSDVLKGKKQLIILTGNAGDGKTAFIQLIESTAKTNGGVFNKTTDNGCKFEFNGLEFETLYDGSQDYDGRNNDIILKDFFKIFEGNSEPETNFVKIIAINEGKLRDFLLHKKEYGWLGKQVHHYLEYGNHNLPPSLSFINLNNRAIIQLGVVESIYDKLLDTILDIDNSKGTWKPCDTLECTYSERCYIRYNVESMRDATKGTVVRQRLKELILSIYLKKEKHITMRDIRSLISFILFNRYTCSQIQKNLDNNDNLLDRIYYNNVFCKEVLDRMVSILCEVDVADMPLPKLENHLYFTNPRTELEDELFVKGNLQFNPDLSYLEKYFFNKPEGTNDTSDERKSSAAFFLSSLKRKVFFEGNDSFTKEQFFINHYNFLPYTAFQKFIGFLEKGVDEKNELRNDLILAISKSERIYNDVVGRENVCIRSNNSKKSLTKAFYGFRAADFEVVLPELGEQSKYIEYFPDHLLFRHVDNSASLEINIDLFEILMRIKEGYVPTSIEIRTFFLNLEMFKRRILSKRSTKVFLTEDDTNLYLFEKSASGKLVLSKTH